MSLYLAAAQYFCQQDGNDDDHIKYNCHHQISVNQQYTSSPDVVVDYSCGLRVVAPTSRATSAMSLSAGGHRGHLGEYDVGRLGHIGEDVFNLAQWSRSWSYWSR